MNKAKQVRNQLGLTPTEAGQILFGYEPKRAYDMWFRWEHGGRMSSPAEAYFDMIIALKGTPWLDEYITLRRNKV